MTQISNQYFIVGDTNPTTQVFATVDSSFKAVSDATFHSWLQLHDPIQQIGGSITATVDNGAGLIRVECVSTLAMQTGQVLDFVGDVTGDAGALAITVIDGTHLDLQGSTFVSADGNGSVLYGATNTATAVGMWEVLDTYAQSQFQYKLTTITTSADVTMTNPPPSALLVNQSGVGKKVILSPMRYSNSYPIGRPAQIKNSVLSTQPFDIYQNDGVTLLTTLKIGETYNFAMGSNATVSAGTIFSQAYPFPIDISRGGNGMVSPTMVGALPAAAAGNQGYRTVVTDALAPVFGAAVAAGGAVVVPVYSTGAAWNVG